MSRKIMVYRNIWKAIWRGYDSFWIYDGSKYEAQFSMAGSEKIT